MKQLLGFLPALTSMQHTGKLLSADLLCLSGKGEEVAREASVTETQLDACTSLKAMIHAWMCSA